MDIVIQINIEFDITIHIAIDIVIEIVIEIAIDIDTIAVVNPQKRHFLKSSTVIRFQCH
jgi:hypothetical protein